MKAIIKFDYDAYVVDTDVALQILHLLEKSGERYTSEYHPSEGETPPFNTHHVWDEDLEDRKSLALLSEKMYRMGKLTGKP